MATVSAEGKRRCDPLLLFKGKGESIAVRQEQRRYDIKVKVQWNEPANSNTDITIWWIRNQLLPAILSYSERQPNDPVLITLDTFPPKCKTSVLQAFNEILPMPVVVAYISEGCTSLLQPLDVSLNKPLKDMIGEIIDQEVEKDLAAWYGGPVDRIKKGLKTAERRIIPISDGVNSGLRLGSHH